MKIKYLFFYSLILFSCSSHSTSEKEHESVKDPVYATTSDTSLQADLSVEKVVLLDTISGKGYRDPDTLLSLEKPDIRPLPFGPKIKSIGEFYNNSFDFYDKLIGEHINGNGIPKLTPTYKLPPVKKWKYILIDSSEENNMCYSNIPIDSLMQLNRYKCRLPDIGNSEVYYMCNNKDLSHDFTAAFERYCSSFIYDQYGYLIVLNKKTQVAQVLNIYYGYYMDSYRLREFYIDKNYKIYLSNKMFAEGDGQVDKSILSTYEISILENGTIDIKSIPLSDKN